jgi:hypothetical protein
MAARAFIDHPQTRRGERLGRRLAAAGLDLCVDLSYPIGQLPGLVPGAFDEQSRDLVAGPLVLAGRFRRAPPQRPGTRLPGGEALPDQWTERDLPVPR